MEQHTEILINGAWVPSAGSFAISFAIGDLMPTRRHLGIAARQDHILLIVSKCS